MRRLAPLLALLGPALAACNGRDEYCGRRYSAMTHMGAHNSAFVGTLPTHNQYVSAPAQLDLGVRFLQLQTHAAPGAGAGGSIELCHTYCWELDAGPLDAYLRALAAWMGTHPDEVVTLLLTNGDRIPVEAFDAAFRRAGLVQYVLRPRGVMAKEEWPTLGEMIDAGTRLVVFMVKKTDYGMDQTKVDYIINEFDYFWETPYGITDKTFPTCAVDRPPGGDPGRLMGIMNHMLNYRLGDVVFPNQPDAARTNSKASIQAQVARCVAAWSHQPNVVLLDWVNIGEVAAAGLALNGLS
ncbi:PLC-like TIM beta alpha-barrel domain [Cordyceps militaris]|uniref:PLC-like TIM beta alpha-barrel domain n=1 Tax=Cordyceps militaris TaxID=73501 RepID=A0A2H4SJH9_CORMI|nr:PLC-like TIM beta alpha-barrel domain [Cordyceps militaris]